MKPVFDVLKTYKDSKKEILKAVERVLSSGRYILGKEVEAFEDEFAKATWNKWCVGVGSGTDAITLSLVALEIGEGDEVIVPNFTAYPTIVGVVRSGAKPVTVDVTETGLIDPEKIQEAITAKTKAIVPVHLFNQYCDMDEILKIANENNLKVVEDCAQRTFTKVSGNLGAFSFYPTKTLGCFGDGGAVCISENKNHMLYYRLRALRDYGQASKNVFVFKGLNSRLDEIQAAILRVKLKNKSFMKQPTYKKSVLRDMEMSQENKNGKETLIHYPFVVSHQKAFDGISYSKKAAEDLSETIYTVSKD